jgi:CRP-like cAMP-binding protein
MAGKGKSPLSRLRLQDVPVFSEVLPVTLERFERVKTFRRFTTAETLFKKGDSVEGVFLVLRGAVKLESVSKDGQNHLLHVSLAGDILGAKALLDDGVYHGTGVAVQEVETYFFPKKDCLEGIGSDHRLNLNILHFITRQLHDLENRLCHATDLTSVERVCEAVIIFSEKNSGSERGWKRKEIAEWAGTTEETVIRTLSQLKHEKIIETDGRKVNVLRPEILRARAKLSPI